MISMNNVDEYLEVCSVITDDIWSALNSAYIYGVSASIGRLTNALGIIYKRLLNGEVIQLNTSYLGNAYTIYINGDNFDEVILKYFDNAILVEAKTIMPVKYIE